MVFRGETKTNSFNILNHSYLYKEKRTGTKHTVDEQNPAPPLLLIFWKYLVDNKDMGISLLIRCRDLIISGPDVEPVPTCVCVAFPKLSSE